MAQQAHPTTLRPINHNLYQGCTYWNEARFYYIIKTIKKLVESCFLKSALYLDNIQIKRHFGLVFIECYILHLHNRSKRRFKSRRYKENKKKAQKTSWRLITARLYCIIKSIQLLTGTQKVTIKLNRLKGYSGKFPKRLLKETAYYKKTYHNKRYSYAKDCAQLVHLIIQKKASAASFSRMIRQNICTRKKRKRHYEFLRYLKLTLRILQKSRKIEGLKIQIKGRFTHKAKSRSRVWKYQMGRMPLSQLNKSIQTEYTQTQTGYGSVGIKIWICTE